MPNKEPITKPARKKNSKMSESADMTSSGEVDVLQLNWTDNPWKPRHMGTSNITDQETEAEEMYRKVRGMLNKMTVHKFTTFKDLMSTLPINGKKEMENVINLIYEKAVNEPMYSRVYAQMCKVLSVLLMPIQLKHRDDPQYSNFSELLLNCCHVKFEKDPEVELRREDWFRQIEAALDPLKKKELKASFEEEERRIRTRFVGNVRFMAEIFQLEMMEVTMMHCCITYLIQGRDEISLEGLCVLLTHVGSYMESKHEDLSLYFTVMKAICKNKGLVSNRLRFMLMDVIVLRDNKWIPQSNIQFAQKYTLRKRQQKIEKTALDGDRVQSFGDTVSITESDKLDSLSIQCEYVCYSAIVHMYSMHMPEDKQIQNVDLPVNWHKEEFFKMVYDTLNKKTIHKFTELVKQLNDHPPRNPSQLHDIVIIIYAKAMEEPIFLVAYARLCRALSEMKVHIFGTTTFKKLLVEYCESEARKNSQANRIRMKEMEEFSQSATVKEEEEHMRRMKLLKLIRFIGDLYIVGILTRTTIDLHIHRLLNEGNEESLECFCILLATAGKDMDSNNLDLYLRKIKNICHVDKKLPERIRLMLQDLIKLLQSWVPQSVLYPEPWYHRLDGSTQESRSTLQSAKSKEVGGASVPSQKEEKMNPKEIKNDEELYKKVHSVLNKLKPQNFLTFVTQLLALPINNSDRLQGVVNLVFEKVVNKPNFSVAYAKVCKVLSGLQVPAERNNKHVPEYVDFRKLLINRCQMEFEKDKKEGLNREAKLREIEATTDSEKKKQLQHNLEKEKRRIQMKSVGNAKFIGELFKLGMLTSKIIMQCYIKHLLQDGSEDSLEYLCALLTTIGKDLEYKNQDLSEYFETMKNISLKKGEVSNKIRLMLQDVIDLRNNKWIPRRDDSNSKSVAHRTPWGQVNRVPQKRKTRDSWQSRRGTSKLLLRDNSARRGGSQLSLQSYDSLSQPPFIYTSSKDISSSGMTPDAKNQSVATTTVLPTKEIQKKTLDFLEEFLSGNTNCEESANCVSETFPTENRSMFVHETLNNMLKRSSSARQNIGRLMSRLIEDDIITLPVYLAGLNEFLEVTDGFGTHDPNFWLNIAECIVPMLLSEVMTFRNLQEISHPVQGKLIQAVLQLLLRDKGRSWIIEKWETGGNHWTDFLPADKDDDFVKENFQKLENILSGALTSSASSSAALSWDHVQQKLEQFLKPDQASSSSFDQICDWIGANVGDKAKEPQFIRALMTAICLSSIESQKNMLKLNESHFQEQQKLLLRYVDNKEELELQCLYAVQSLINELEHPQGLLCQIFQELWFDRTISRDSFIAWKNSNDPAEQAGRGVALKSLTVFFYAL